MLYFKTFLTSVFAVIVLFLFTKLMGKRQISQLSLFDYINGITIGSIAAEIVISEKMSDIISAFISIAVFTFSAILIAFLGDKSIKLRRFFTGTSLILYDNEKIFKNNLKKSRLDLGEFLSMCRISGYFDISQLQTVILEPNGKLSFLPKSENRPATPNDMNIKPQKDGICPAVIIDGKIMQKNLKACGLDEIFLKKEIALLGYKSEKEIFLATVDNQNKVSAFAMSERCTAKDYFT